VKATLVVLFFMDLMSERPTAAFAFAAGLILVTILLVFVMGDVVMRTAPPIASPPGMTPRAYG
jgi:caa(3)-type oxidase subunit IV